MSPARQEAAAKLTSLARQTLGRPWTFEWNTIARMSSLPCRMKHGEMAYNRAEGEAQDLAELEEMDERRDGRRSFWRLLERL